MLRESECSYSSLLNNVTVGVVDIGSAVLKLQSPEILTRKRHIRDTKTFTIITVLFHVGYMNLLKKMCLIPKLEF